MVRPALFTAALVGLLLAGCGGAEGGESEDTEPAEGSFASVDVLVEAVADAGWECDVALESPVSGDNIDGTRFCSPVEDAEALSFEVFQDDEAFDDGVENVEGAAEVSVEYGYAVASYIVGANWIVDGPIAVLERIHGDLGGELVDLTPDTDTPEEFASVVAANESDWREVIDGAFDCRYIWVFESDRADTVTQLDALSCYMREVTIGLTAQNAVEELDALVAPPEVFDLVAETTVALEEIVAVDLEAVCGHASGGRNDSAACTTAIGQRNLAYMSLEQALDGWRPYL